MPYAVVPGEEDLGTQKRCPGCGEWWPAMDEEFWIPIVKRGRNGWFAYCRACNAERNARRRCHGMERAVGLG